MRREVRAVRDRGAGSCYINLQTPGILFLGSGVNKAKSSTVIDLSHHFLYALFPESAHIDTICRLLQKVDNNTL